METARAPGKGPGGGVMALDVVRWLGGRWLPDTKNQLPPNASHQVGVGAFVLNDKDEVLVVREKNGEGLGRSAEASADGFLEFPEQAFRPWPPGWAG